MDNRHYYDKTYTSSIWTIAEAGHQALGLIIIVIIVLLLSGSGWRLGWR